MTVFLFIRKCCVCTCWKKWRPFFFWSFTKTGWWKLFRWKWTHFRKINKGRLSFFWSWRHFLDTSRLTKILEGTLLWPSDKWKLETIQAFQTTVYLCNSKEQRGLTDNTQTSFIFVYQFETLQIWRNTCIFTQGQRPMYFVVLLTLTHIHQIRKYPQ